MGGFREHEAWVSGGPFPRLPKWNICQQQSQRVFSLPPSPAAPQAEHPVCLNSHPLAKGPQGNPPASLAPTQGTF